MDDETETAGLRAYPIARRGALMTGLISGFTLATQRVEAQAIHTDTAGLEAGETRIPTSDGELPAYFAKPAHKGPFPVILVNEEIFGVHEYIKDVCRRWAKLGYLAVATEYYARIGDLSKMTDVKQIVTDVIAKAPDAQYMSDLDSTAAWALEDGGSSGGRDGVLPRRPADLALCRAQPEPEGRGRVLRAAAGRAFIHSAADRTGPRRVDQVPAAGTLRRAGCQHHCGFRA